jgi:phenylacetate-CoA ligase
VTARAERYFDARVETLPRRDLAALQMERVRACVERLQTSGHDFYRQRLGGVRASELTAPADLAGLPFTTKNDLRDHYPFGLLLVPPRQLARIHASSGSTGTATVVGYTARDLDLWSHVMARSLVAGGLTSDDVFQNAYGHGLFTGGLGFHQGASLIGATVVPTSTGNTPRQVALLRDFAVTAYAATPSYSLHIAEVAAAEGVDVRASPLRAGYLGAEPMSEAMRREIEARLGVTVYEQYGLSEIIGPGVAAACSRLAGLHIWEDHFIPEIIHPESGMQLPEGEVGELVLTAPTKEALPLVRYRTRDRCRLLREPCACGRTAVRIEKILGRTDDMLIVRGVNVFPSQIEHAIVGIAGLAPQYQIELRTRHDRQDEILVRVEMTGDAAVEPAARVSLEGRTRAVLQSSLAISVVVELVTPGALPRSEGKAVRVIDRRGTEER